MTAEQKILDLLCNPIGVEYTGPELVKISNGILKRGTIYTKLTKLEETDEVRVRIEKPEDKLSKRFYRIGPGQGQKNPYSTHQLNLNFT